MYDYIGQARPLREQLCKQIGELAPTATNDTTAETVSLLMRAEKTIDELSVALLAARTSVQVVDCDREHAKEPGRVVEWLRGAVGSMGKRRYSGRRRIQRAIESAPHLVPARVALPSAPAPTAMETAEANVNAAFRQIEGPPADSVLAELEPPKATGPIDWDRTETFHVPDDIARDMQEVGR